MFEFRKVQARDVRWYVVSVCSRREKQCNATLLRMGIETFLPLQKQLRKWSDRNKEVEMPLFPGYIFVKIDLSQKLEVLSVPGVVRFIRFGSEDTPVPEIQIKAI